MRVKHLFWTIIFVTWDFRQINCDDEKFRREISSGFYNSDIHNEDAKNFGKNDNDKQDKSSAYLSPFDQVFAALSGFGLSANKNVKTSSTYWPPDMDKEKFRKMWEQNQSPSFTQWLNLQPASGINKQMEPVNFYPINEKEVKPEHVLIIPSKKKKVDEPVNLLPIKVKERKKKPVQLYSVTENFEPVNSYPDKEFVVNEEEKESFSTFVSNDYNYYHNDYSIAPTESFYTHPPSPVTLSYDQRKYVAPRLTSTTTDNSLFSYDAAMTNSGPVIFPTVEATTARSNTRFAAIATFDVVPRINKKRKLKKKVKTSSPITQLLSMDNNITQAPPLSFSVADATTEKTSLHYTPTYEIEIDNGSFNYMDIINNLSNLTELTYSSNNSTGNNVKYEKEAEMEHVNKNRYSSKIVNNNGNDFDITTPSFIINVESSDFSNLSGNYNKSKKNHDNRNSSSSSSSHRDETTENYSLYTTSRLASTTISQPPSSTLRLKILSKLKPNTLNMESVLGELKKAIDDNDILKVKNIVNQYDENSSISYLMNAMVLNASLKLNEKDIAPAVKLSTTETPASMIISSTSKIHRSRFGSYRNMKAKYIDALKADQQPATSTQLPSSKFFVSTTFRAKNLKSKTTVSSVLESSTLKYLLRTSIKASSLKPREDKLATTVKQQQYTVKSRNHQIRRGRTTNKSQISTSTNKSRRTTKKL